MQAFSGENDIISDDVSVSMWLIRLNWHYEHIREMFNKLKYISILSSYLCLAPWGIWGIVSKPKVCTEWLKYLQRASCFPQHVKAPESWRWHLGDYWRVKMWWQWEMRVAELMASLCRCGVSLEVHPIMMSYPEMLSCGWRFLLFLEYCIRVKEKWQREQNTVARYLCCSVSSFQGPLMSFLFRQLKHGPHLLGWSWVLEHPCYCWQGGRKTACGNSRTYPQGRLGNVDSIVASHVCVCV